MHILLKFGSLAATLAVPTVVVAAEYRCEGGDTACLTESIITANQNPDSDTIFLASGLYEATTVSTGFSPGPTCLPVITSSIEIIGAGRGATTIARPDSVETPPCRIIYVTGTGELKLQDLTISNGLLLNIGDSIDSSGAGILNHGALVTDGISIVGNRITELSEQADPGSGVGLANFGTSQLNSSIIDDNHAACSYTCYGGGIYNQGTLHLVASQVTNNTAQYGAGISSNRGGSDESALTIAGSTISGNSTVSVDPSTPTGLRDGSMAGGIHSTHGMVVVDSAITDNRGLAGAGIHGSGTIRNSLIANNNATGGQGGGLLFGDGLIINSTITGNRTLLPTQWNWEENLWIPPVGGALYTWGGDISFINTTITDNHSAVGAGGVASGNPFEPEETQFVGSITFKNSIVIGNHGSRPGNSDCELIPTHTQYSTQGFNLFGRDTGCTSTSGQDLVVDADSVWTEVLKPLADNGGPTATHALWPNSPAVDAAEPICTDESGVALAFDQRGMPRSRCDIGAFELQQQAEVTANFVAEGHSTIPINSNRRIQIVIPSQQPELLDFEPVTEIARASITAGPAAAIPCSFLTRDEDGDGVDDLIIRFESRKLGLGCDDDTLALQGLLDNGQSFSADLTVRMVGCH